MDRKNFEIIIASSPDREKVFCEIFYREQFICDISQEDEKLVLGLYSSAAETMQIPLQEFQETIEAAKQHLLGGN